MFPERNFFENIKKESYRKYLTKACLCNIFSVGFFLCALKEELALIVTNNLPYVKESYAYQNL